MFNTSTEAYNAIKPVIPSLQKRVLTLIESAEYGLTTFELVTKLSAYDAAVIENSVRPRLSELLRKNKIVQDGTRRNARGRSEKVWLAA